MDPFLAALASARQEDLLATAAPRPCAAVHRTPARQRFGWWLMELGLRLATPPPRPETL
ncbi:hypothetical protein [Amycolatopsis jejuensis]|uniref:hypothetical protein n=1 Tax=Amycolatopsis jejuensis TaxID=330084 RepID=UPI000A565C8B|nr:hypothetical protein [Amycolatopsis jejuensis]